MRLLAPVGVVALLAASCGSDGEPAAVDEAPVDEVAVPRVDADRGGLWGGCQRERPGDAEARSGVGLVVHALSFGQSTENRRGDW